MSDINNLPVSYEFFPPKTDKGHANLQATLDALMPYRPDFTSVTFGAGGSTRETTYQTIAAICDRGDVRAVPHISCIDSNKSELAELLDKYHELGIDQLVVLRGDLPDGVSHGGDFNHANELVSFIREQHDDHFKLAVAAYPEVHPESANAADDFKHLSQKLNAGADLAITQYFYNIDGFYRLQDLISQAGHSQLLLPGIMPIKNIDNLARFSAACGAEIPRWILKTMASFADDPESQQAFGLDVVTKLCADLIDHGVDGLHFYTMNQSALVTEILNRLGMRH